MGARERRMCLGSDGARERFWVLVLWPFLAVVASPTLWASQWSWKPIGPPGSIRALVVDPKKPGRVYGASYADVFVTTDGGERWRSLGRISKDVIVRSLAVDPGRPTTLYAGSESRGMFKSLDGGRTWQEINLGLRPPNKRYWSMSIGQILINQSDPKVLVVGTSDGAYRSEDAGQLWTKTDLPCGPVLALAMGSAVESAIYAGPLHQGIYRSGDGGKTWTRAAPLQRSPAEIVDANVTALIVSPGSETRLFVLARRSGFPPLLGGPLFRSDDSGGNWVPVPLPSFAGEPVSLATDPRQGRQIFVMTSRGAFATGDSGATWVKLGLKSGDLPLSSIAIAQGSYGEVIASGPQGVFRLRSDRDTWQQCWRGLPRAPTSAVASDPTDGITIYAATENYVRVSRNEGETWTLAKATQSVGCDTTSFWFSSTLPGTAWITSLFLVPGVACGNCTCEVASSTDRGVHWQAETTTTGTRLVPFVVDPFDFKRRYAGFAGQDDVFQSVDGGGHWSATGLNRAPEQLLCDAGRRGRIYAVTADGAFRADDAGRSWVRVIDKRLAPENAVLAISPADSKIMFVSHSGGRAVHKSVDDGRVWTPVLRIGATSLVMDHHHANRVYAAGSNSDRTVVVAGSDDAGRTWVDFTGRLLWPASSLALSRDGTRLYVATSGGVFELEVPPTLDGFARSTELAYTDPQ
jgi:photosystem II stability/assembly factor-like uncharacterized protein